MLGFPRKDNSFTRVTFWPQIAGTLWVKTPGTVWVSNPGTYWVKTPGALLGEK
jgi:hypothetical protein